MGQVTFNSPDYMLDVPALSAYSFFFDLNNLQKLMPEQIINWQSTEDSCAFDIKGMAHITLNRSEAIPEKLVKIVSGPETPIELEIRGNFEAVTDKSCKAWIELLADLSPMLKLMASSPLQNLVNIMAEKLKSQI